MKSMPKRKFLGLTVGIIPWYQVSSEMDPAKIRSIRKAFILYGAVTLKGLKAWETG
jgi:hypothetical protein